MKGRLPYVVILGGSLTFVVSLYFIWVRVSAPACTHPTSAKQHLLCQLSGSEQSHGWGLFGEVAAVLAIVLAGAAVAALARPDLARRVPLGKGALALGIFALLNVAALSQSAVVLSRLGVTAGLAPASYVGLASAAAVCLAAAGIPRGEAFAVPSPVTAVAQVLSLGVIASSLLPAFDKQGTVVSGGVFVCVFACLSVAAWSKRGTPAARLAVSVAIAALVAGDLLPIRSYHAFWPYELWLLVACTAALLVLGVLGIRGVKPLPLAASERAVVAAGVLLLVALFLPWQAGCDVCTSESGWGPGRYAGVCVLVLLVGQVSLRRFLPEFAIGAAIFVAATYGSNLRYGAAIGFFAAAALLVLALRSLLPLPWRGFLVRLIPVTAALGVLSLDLAPLAGYSTFAEQSPWQWLSLLAAISAVATIRLLTIWCRTSSNSDEVVLLPLGLLVMTALDLADVGTIGHPNDVTWHYPAISWQGWVSALLCLLLVGCGWAERYGGGLRIPDEIWRVDRISAVED